MIELAKNCFRTTESRTLSKVEAARQQLEGAIANLFLGNWACAITLAGAAEDMLPAVEGKEDLYGVAKSIGSNHFQMTGKETHDFLNDQLIWLKHKTVNKPTTKKFQQDDAIIMIIRGLTRLKSTIEKTSPNMDLFVEWISKEYPNYMTETNALPHGTL